MALTYRVERDRGSKEFPQQLTVQKGRRPPKPRLLSAAFIDPQ
jgi:hypothetical protein